MLPDEILLAEITEQGYLTLEEKTQQTALCHQSLIKDLTGFDTVFTGSRAICPHHCTPSSDWDYIALVPDVEYLDRNVLGDDWWVNGCDDRSCQRKGFVSCKLKLDTSINLILTHQLKFFCDFVEATNLAIKYVAKGMDLSLKEQRIRFFSHIMGEKVEDRRLSWLPDDQRIK